MIKKQIFGEHSFFEAATSCVPFCLAEVIKLSFATSKKKKKKKETGICNYTINDAYTIERKLFFITILIAIGCLLW